MNQNHSEQKLLHTSVVENLQNIKNGLDPISHHEEQMKQQSRIWQLNDRREIDIYY